MSHPSLLRNAPSEPDRPDSEVLTGSSDAASPRPTNSAFCRKRSSARTVNWTPSCSGKGRTPRT
jgi:hypothetical protein